MSSPPRLAWIDDLRTAMILFVVNMHACVTCGHLGSCYVKEGPEPPALVKVVFLFWQGHLQAFFIGLLFSVAGVFAHRSLARLGAGRFIRERALGLGLPALLDMVLIRPFMVHGLLGQPRVPNRPSLIALYADYLASGRMLSGSGPLWFALALLGFCLMLAGWRSVCAPPTSPKAGHLHKPTPKTLLVFGCSLVIATFTVRLVYPIGTEALNFQLCFFAQCIAAFVAGVAAGRGEWLRGIAASRRARIAGWLGLIGGPVLLALVMALGGPPT